MSYNYHPGSEMPVPLEFKHFPDRMSCFIFRNWNMLSVECMARVLGTSAANIQNIAELMGLPGYDEENTGLWRKKGYISLIRQNWHLLPYDQLIQMLGMTEEEFTYCLKEDDFLWSKVGFLKPDAAPLVYETPSEETIVRLRQIKSELDPELLKNSRKFAPFHFGKGSKVVPEKTEHLRMIYPYSANYGDPLLDDGLSDFSDGMLREYGESGINGIWFQAVLYKLIPWDRCPEMSGEWQRRLRNLKRLTERAARHGVGIYLYLNEPRAVMPQWADRFADLKGAESLKHKPGLCLCTGKAPVKDYLRNAMTELFTACPGLAGIFAITRSENATNCAYSSEEHKATCPICSKRPTADIVAEVLTALAEGVAAAKPSARIMANTWAWRPEEIKDTIRQLPKNVTVLSVSEWAVETDVEGFKGSVSDYSISHPGPSPRVKENWEFAARCGLSIAAKIQINNSWEMSAVPYIPVFDLLEKHVNDLRKAGVRDFMLSWTLGGAPSPMIGLLSKSKNEVLKELYGSAADRAAEASRIFSEAFSEFPFDSTYCIYKAPMNYGPMNLLWLEPTGYKATMVGFPYDDIDTWRYRYPEEVFSRAFHRVADGWAKGLPVLERAAVEVEPVYRRNFEELLRYAKVTYCHFKATSNAVDFIMLRRDIAGNRQKLIAILENEIELAKCVGRCQCEDAKVAYEASNHYYYTPNLIQEKILNCNHLLRKLKG